MLNTERTKTTPIVASACNLQMLLFAVMISLLKKVRSGE